MSTVIDFQNVSVVRGGKAIIESISFQATSDQRWVILGANGAGKTTMLRVCAAQIHPSSGSASILGSRLGEVNVFELRTRIGFSSTALANQIPNSETVLYSDLTAINGVTGRWTQE
jgi:iron complex transport system ATP-binding protein